jgi:type II secretory pathway pseudopilin PulG
MDTKYKIIFTGDNESGATAVLVTVVIVVLIGIAAMAVDVGYVMATKNELQNVADAAALAATRQLGVIYSGLPYEQQANYTLDATDRTKIENAATDVAQKNKAGGKNIYIPVGEIEIGTWDQNRNPRFIAETNKPDAVRVGARRDDVANGPITSFFAVIFGRDNFSVSADATAALTGQGTTIEGEIELPAGISLYRFQNEYCNTPIRFYPTGTLYGCAGWHTFEAGANANELRAILDGMTDGTFESPATAAGSSELEYIGGNVASAFPSLEALFMERSVATQDQLYISPQGDDPTLVDADSTGALPLLDSDGNPKYKRIWQTVVPVYESSDCSNPNNSLLTVAYATVEIHAINGSVVSPTHAKFTVFGEIKCDSLYDGRGGGLDVGTKGTIPGLVE